MVLLALLSALAVSGQMRMHLYLDDNLIYRDMVAHIDNGVVRMGAHWSGEIVYTVKANNTWGDVQIFSGYSTSNLDIAFTLREDKLYLGDSSFSDAILYTFDSGQIFMGDSNFPLDVAYTLRKEARNFPSGDDAPLWGLYKDDSRSWDDRLAILEGHLDPASIFALLSAAGWL